MPETPEPDPPPRVEPEPPAGTEPPTPVGRVRRGGLLRRRYGASPLHLLVHVAAIVFVAWTLGKAFDPRFARPVNLAAWLIGGALLHDLVLLPAYSVLDRLVQRIARRRHAAGSPARRPVALINHLRVPAVISGAMLIVYLPFVLDRAPQNFVADAGYPPPDHLARWALVTAGLFLVSAVVYLARITVARSRRRRTSP